MIPLLENMDFQGCGLGISEYSGCFNLRENCTLRSVAASLKASGKLNVKARDLILYTDLPMYASYVVLKNCPYVMNGLEDIKA